MGKGYLSVGRRVYRNDSVLLLVRQNTALSNDPEEIIRHKVQEKLIEARSIEWSGPPFNPKIVASLMGIKCEPSEELVYSEDAELHPMEGGRLVIKYNSVKPKTRQNFSIAHETVHAFFPDFKEMIQERRRDKIGKFDPQDEVEFLCDLGASEILLPFPEFQKSVSEYGIGIDAFEYLRGLYEASREATAIRMMRATLFPCAVVFFDYGLSPNEKDKIEQEKKQLSLFDSLSETSTTNLQKLRVQFCISSDSFSEYVPMHKSVDEESPIYTVSVTNEPFKGNTTLDFGSRRKEFYIEAIPAPSTITKTFCQEVARVIAFLFMQPPSNQKKEMTM